jgi:quercetin dioxygenase-like cupin family protein
MNVNRREALGMTAAFALLAQVADAQMDGTAPTSRLFKFSELPAKTNPSGAGTRGLPKEAVPVGTVVGMHFSSIEPGKLFSPLHRNPDCEIRMIMDGRADWLVGDKPAQPVERGDVIFSAPNDLNTMGNSSDKPVTYFVVTVRITPQAVKA